MSRPFQIVDVEQRTPAWFVARAGRVTSSCAAQFLSAPKKGQSESVQRRNLRQQLALERIVGRPLSRDYQSSAMRAGAEKEEQAVAAYEAHSDRLVRRVGFVQHLELMAGWSPDGLIGEWEGGLELKCPEWNAHLEFLEATEPPANYRKQVVHALALTDLPWIDLAFFSPDFPEPLQLKVMRIARDEREIDAYRLALKLFLGEVEQQEQQIRALAETGVAV